MAAQGERDTLSLGIADAVAGADVIAAECPHPAVSMEIGDLVIHGDRSYVLRGFEPISVPDRRAELADPATGEVVFVPVAELVEPLQTGGGFGSRP
jgi:hypothetical protein